MRQESQSPTAAVSTSGLVAIRLQAAEQPTVRYKRPGSSGAWKRAFPLGGQR